MATTKKPAPPTMKNVLRWFLSLFSGTSTSIVASAAVVSAPNTVSQEIASSPAITAPDPVSLEPVPAPVVSASNPISREIVTESAPTPEAAVSRKKVAFRAPDLVPTPHSSNSRKVLINGAPWKIAHKVAERGGLVAYRRPHHPNGTVRFIAPPIAGLVAA